jgi:chemotaxis protein MotB
MAAKDSKNGRGTVVIKKEEIVEGGHHGGAWKVAYADFVTAMMAFFLLMWLLNATTEAQRKGLADYFTPMNAMSRSTSGNGQPFGGHTPYDQGELASDRGAASVTQGKAPPPPQDDSDGDTPVQDTPLGPAEAGGRAGMTEAAHGNAAARVDQEGEQAPGGGAAPRQAQSPAKADLLANAGAGAAAKPSAAQTEKQAFRDAAQQIRDAVRADPALAELARQLAIDITPDGLRIQLLDEDQQPMFATGSATLRPSRSPAIPTPPPTRAATAATGICRQNGPMPRAACSPMPGCRRAGSARSPAAPTTTRCCRPTRWLPPTGGSPFWCCARRMRTDRAVPC